jgi:uncharacterized protein (TIGR02569 family)
MTETAPSTEVLEAFGLEGPPRPLSGGEGRSWLANGVVLKPDADDAEWEWLAGHLPLARWEGIRIAAPIPATDGRWVVHGWCAQEKLDGDHPAEPRWPDVFEACRLFHRAVRDLPRPACIDARTDPWSVGDRAAWEERAPPHHPLIDALVGARRPIDLPSQLVHGDMAENVLFADGADPAVIDISPCWRLAGFAAAIVFADVVCWRDADPERLLDCVSDVREFPQHLVRALIYRMTTSVVVAEGDPDLEGYRRTVRFALRLCEEGD